MICTMTVSFWFLTLVALQDRKGSAFQVSPFNNCFVPLRRTFLNSKTYIDLKIHSISDDIQSTSPSKKTQSKRKITKTKTTKTKSIRNPTATNTWRIYGVEVDPDSLGKSALVLNNENNDDQLIPIERMYLTQPVLDSLYQRLKIDVTVGNMDNVAWSSNSDHHLSLPPQLKDVRMVRRSIDARKKKVLGEGPRYTYVLDIDLTTQTAIDLKLKNQAGRNEIVTPDMHIERSPLTNIHAINEDDRNQFSEKKKVIVVGAGPAGLFCALSLAQSGCVIPILLERGQAVESRGKDIGALIHRNTMNSESNFAFGEGGAGTWSDGKLTTRIGRNSKNVRTVLETFVKFGAPEKILVDGAPHLGTDNLVKMLRNMRAELRALGGKVLFGAKMTKIVEGEDDTGVGRIRGVEVVYSSSLEKGVDQTDMEIKDEGATEIIYGDAVVIATGHSARDVYEQLHRSGVKLEPKGFAAGFRVEHPQRVINRIQYGKWGPNAWSGKKTTDALNQSYFASSYNNNYEVHTGRLPVPSYRLATDKAYDGENNRGVYSFCM